MGNVNRVLGRYVLIIIAAPVVSIILGVGIFLIGTFISRVNDPLGEYVSILGGVIGAPIIYGGFVFVRFKAGWVSVLCTLAGLLGTCGLTYLGGASYLHYEGLHHGRIERSDQSADPYYSGQEDAQVFPQSLNRDQ